MAIGSRMIFMEDREDDGPTAVRDFPVGCMSGPRRFEEDTNRPLEVTNRERKLPDNFYNLPPREQFLERRRLFNRLYRYYSGHVRTPALEAMKQMNTASSSYEFKGLGSVPGVEVGDTFDFRAEIYVVGLHRTAEAGIACVNLGNERIACSIVVSGGYKDNIDDGDVIYYTGHGGNDEHRVGKKEDQKLKGGNKALLNSLKQKTLVRVIRGREHGRTRKEIEGLNGKITSFKKFSYDGLYTVVKHEFVVGSAGCKIHRFMLIRQRGQPFLDRTRLD